MKAGRVFM
jgi:hypothetical protein